MKRGLVVRDPKEISDEEWAQRTSVLQRRMTAESLDLVLIYGDVFRSDDIGYLTNLCIYWNEGMLAVPREGEPAFLTKLSPRVHTWMRRVSTVTDLRSGKSFAQLVKDLIADRTPGVIGLVDAGLWPTTTLDEIMQALAGWEVRTLGAIVGEQRAMPSPAELELLRCGAGMLSAAIDAATANGQPVAEAVAQVELALRGGGFTDVMIQKHPVDREVVSLRVTGEYRHGWVHVGRVLDSSGHTPWVASLRSALDATIDGIKGATSAPQLGDAARAHLMDLPSDAVWTLRCVNQTEMATGGELQPDDKVYPPGTVVVVSLEIFFGELSSAIVADTVLLTATGSERLTASRPTSVSDVGQEFRR